METEMTMTRFDVGKTYRTERGATVTVLGRGNIANRPYVTVQASWLPYISTTVIRDNGQSEYIGTSKTVTAWADSLIGDALKVA